MVSRIRVADVSVGSDPEFFVVSKQTGKPVPASRLGFKSVTRLNPCNERPDDHVGYDNACVELQPRYRTCLQGANGCVSRVLHWALQRAEKHKCFARFTPIMKFDMADIAATPTTHEFGCSPSFVVEDGIRTMNEPRVEPLETNLRSAGYHVHIGKPNISEEIRRNMNLNSGLVRSHDFLDDETNHPMLAQTCDLVAGLPSVLLTRNSDEAIRRETLGYGRASEYRSPKHGFEYRTLSSWPLCSPVWTWWAHASVRDAVSICVYNVDLPSKIDMQKVAKAINEVDIELAAEMWFEVKLLLRELVWPRYHKDQTGRTVVCHKTRVKELEFAMTTYDFKPGIPTREWTSNQNRAYHIDWQRHMLTKTNNKNWRKFYRSWSETANCVSEK
jgi:hypothetical protein